MVTAASHIPTISRNYHNMMELFHHIYVFGATITMIVVVFIPSSPPNFKENVFTIIFAIYFILILLFLVTFAFMYGRKSRYAEANKPISESLQSLKEAYRYLDCCYNDDHSTKFYNPYFVNLLTEALTGFNNAYILTSSVNCRTSLKLIGQEVAPNNDSKDAYNNSLDFFYVRTLSRDSVSKKKKETFDLNEDNKHKLSKNTDFRKLTNPTYGYFFSNDLSKEIHYENSSDKDVFLNKVKRKDYNSAIVWPIRYVYSNEETAQESITKTALGEQILYGFITVDSVTRGAFREEFDIDLGKPVADALYPILDLYQKVRQKEGDYKKIDLKRK